MLRRLFSSACPSRAALVHVAPRVARVVAGSLVLATGAACGATETTSAVGPALGASSGASYSTQSTHTHDNHERVVISGYPITPGVAQFQLVATACEPLEHLQKAAPSPCGDGWQVDRDAKITWSSINDNATVDDHGLVTTTGPGTYAIIAFSNDNGGACTAVGTAPGPIYYGTRWKKDHLHLSEPHEPRTYACVYHDGSDDTPS